jgi:hypothetical protein
MKMKKDIEKKDYHNEFYDWKYGGKIEEKMITKGGK